MRLSPGYPAASRIIATEGLYNAQCLTQDRAGHEHKSFFSVSKDPICQQLRSSHKLRPQAPGSGCPIGIGVMIRANAKRV